MKTSKGNLEYFVIPQNPAILPKVSAASVQALADKCGAMKPVAHFTAHCLGTNLNAPAAACVDSAAAVTKSLSPQIWHGDVKLATKTVHCWVLPP